MPADSAIDVSAVSHRYGSRTAVDGLSLSVASGEIFVFLGPNGSGKTTLFRVLSTLIPLQSGEITILGYSLRTNAAAIRSRLGVVFQAPSLDKKLTVAENLHHQGKLYGLGGASLRHRCDEMLTAQSALPTGQGRSPKNCPGGMRRRVELAKGLLHRPQLLLLDEPSTGLDPGARSDLWKYLQQIRTTDGVTIVLTTHLLEEAERADRIAIMHEGHLAALIRRLLCRHRWVAIQLRFEPNILHNSPTHSARKFACEVVVLENTVRLEQPDGHLWIARLVEAFPREIETITLGKPTLEDVFIDRTGHRFWNQEITHGS